MTEIVRYYSDQKNNNRYSHSIRSISIVQELMRVYGGRPT